MVVDVVLVQHAEKERRRGDPGLTKVGHRQAQAVAADLAAFSWDVVLASPLLRARQTAAPIAEACGLALSIDDRLRERMNWGDHGTDQTLDEFLRDWARASTDRLWTPPTGTSSLDTGRRMLAALTDVVQRGARRALAVTHGGATVDLLRELLSDAEVDALAPGVIDSGVPSCGLTRLVFDRTWTVHEVGVVRS
jgi:broad specificity phosphatase PhoE